MSLGQIPKNSHFSLNVMIRRIESNQLIQAIWLLATFPFQNLCAIGGKEFLRWLDPRYPARRLCLPVFHSNSFNDRSACRWLALTLMQVYLQSLLNCTETSLKKRYHSTEVSLCQKIESRRGQASTAAFSGRYRSSRDWAGYSMASIWASLLRRWSSFARPSLSPLKCKRPWSALCSLER